MDTNLQQFNGERLKAARIYRGLTVAELAGKLDLQRQTVSMYENDKIRNPEYSTIKDMSNALGFPIKFFLQESDMNTKVGSTYFRALLTTNKKYRNQQVQKMNFLTTVYLFLSEYIEFPTLNLPIIQGEIDPEKAAEQLRIHWKLGDKPIENIIYLVEKNGILVSRFDSETNDIDAFSQMLDINGESVFLIGYSKNKGTAARIHFDIAHELGHILMHEWSEDIETLSKEEFKERENQAHSFASAFLLPKETFSRDVGVYANNLSYYVELKKKWKVSISAMIRRAYTLKLIDYHTYQNLMRKMQKEGIKKYEPLDDVLVTATPSLLKTSVQMLVNDGVLTSKELLNELADDFYLSLESAEIEDLLDLPKDFLKVSNVIPIHSLRVKKGLS
ncbi:Zn-dependent peptidase ImmA (M78 family) [Anaerospora hongkongensis]|uniref:Zn-dependent peptidase ImmA (M78 family) n=1 Tax=Anaerospora hongkongensis TaxID=244830 RepID=A0A4R1Q847_9FIRM|nr:XRE family transcriptional regulator [Anaerospora hongkongensis]TCL37723.1 Zn-dependent peptidase ImmA (M78 family) [Anaerospora hongkongensis]